MAATKSTTGSSASARRSGAKGRTPRRSTEQMEARAGGIAVETGDGPDETEERHGGVVLAEHVAPADSTPLALAPPGGAVTSKFSDNGGKVLQVTQVQLVYWGSAWASTTPPANPSSAAVTNDVRAMLHSAYMTGLAEYRGIGRGFLRGATVITSSDPPSGFTDDQVWTFIDGQITAGTLPAPDVDDQTLYVVVMPQGVNSSNTAFIGEHTYRTRGGVRVPFAWITNNGTLSSVTRIISHEVVEAATDPEGSAILGTAGTCTQGGWCEIGDICSSTQVRDGVTVQSFWSDVTGACIVPDWPARSYPRSGVQFSGSLPANGTGRWFTFRWPEWERVEWWMLPTNPRPGAAQVSWDVAIERASGNYLTYWLTVKNLTNVPLTFEGRYTVLGRE
jgi:hypothetical protein